MKAVVYYGPDDFRLKDLPTPKIGEGEILVRVRACGICATDIAKARFRKAKLGTVLGHEISGDVIKTGSEVTNFKVGDRVGVLHHAPCGACYYCRRGEEPLCDQYRRTSVDPGGFAEYIRVSPELVKKSVIKIPDNLSYEEATLIETTACCIRGILRCEISAGDTLLIMGGGPVGLIHTQLARHLGASQVIVSDYHNFRVGMAKRLGADHAFNPMREDVGKRVRELTEGRGADVVIVAVASTAAVHEGLELARDGGKICVFGDFRDTPQPSLEIDPNLMIHYDKRLFGSWGCSPENYHTAFNLIRMGRVKAKELITHVLPIDRFEEALSLVERREEALKVVIKP